MGWTFIGDHNPNETRADIIRREFTTAPTEKDPIFWGFEYMAVRGSTVYAIMYRENPSEGTPRVYFGIVFLTQRKKGEFGYKEIGEECGPYGPPPPVRMLDLLDRLAPEPNGYALDWRARCRAAHADKKRRAKIQWAPGMRVQFTPTGRVFEILADAGPRRGFFVRVADRSDLQQYRATARSFAHAVIVNERPAA
jgi:hypothetical protein